MTFLKLDQSPRDPFAQPTWVQDIEDATPFDRIDRASEARLRIADASGITYEDQRWYVVKI